ncbi:hypothetical protein D3C75_1355280 [compost metagenome]
MPERIDPGEHRFCLRRDQFRQVGMDKLYAHFLQQFTHRFITAGGPDADAFIAQKLHRIAA